MKFKWYYIIFSVLAVIALFYLFTTSNGTLNKRKSNFAVENINEITSIELNDGKQILTLTKEDFDWIVNRKYIVKEWNIKNFLTALNRIKVLSPVSKSETEQIVMLLQNDGVKIDVFKGNRHLKQFTVSKPSMNKSKTYMLMNKSKEPFVVHIPLFKGLVSDLFITDENYWRDKIIFNYKPQNIESIDVDYYQDITKSYIIKNYNDGTFSLYSKAVKKNLEEFDVNKVATFFTYFQNINFEGVLDNQNQNYIDSTLSSDPFARISIIDYNGVEKSVTLYRKPADKEFDEFGQKSKFDYHKAYGVMNNSNEIILIPYYNIDPILKEIDYFR